VSINTQKGYPMHHRDPTQPLNLRIDQALRRRLAAEAELSMRSLNAEILYRLRKSIEAEAERTGPARGDR
jgi:predicted HicB family RNase H-like nuclease